MDRQTAYIIRLYAIGLLPIQKRRKIGTGVVLRMRRGRDDKPQPKKRRKGNIKK